MSKMTFYFFFPKPLFYLLLKYHNHNIHGELTLLQNSGKCFINTIIKPIFWIYNKTLISIKNTKASYLKYRKN